MKKDLLSFIDLKPSDVDLILKKAKEFKALRGKKKHPKPLEGKTLALIFEKSSTRTRVSFEVAMKELGGDTICLTSQDSQLGRGESYADTARVLSRYVHGIMIRTFSQNVLEEMARYASIPVMNGLSDLFHPVQVLADLLTIVQVKKNYKDQKIVYVGDGNNLANSWMDAAMLLGFELNVACPKGFEPQASLMTQVHHAPNITLTHDPVEAVKSADVIYTDTWFSMGQKEDPKKKQKFMPFQVNRELLSHAAKDAMVLHCLPAHRGEEITDEVMDGPQSYVFDEAENRLHVQKAILALLMG
ncbi:MAG: ornithine carbamoyltransferase [Deltaproteobacteria bacterium]|nr:ornithine carbamoyltransferase [Deltaproteobacteria bacterium]